MKKSIIILLSLFLLLISGYSIAESNQPFTSVKMNWVDDSGKAFSFESLLGQPYVLAMIYTSCRATCPVTIQKLERIRKLATEKGISPKFVLVSFDAVNDTPETLHAFREKNSLKEGTWTLLHGSEQEVRKLSVLLGVSYQRDAASGEITHSNQQILIDQKGAVNLTLSGLASEVEPLIEALLKIENQSRDE